MQRAGRQLVLLSRTDMGWVQAILDKYLLNQM